MKLNIKKNKNKSWFKIRFIISLFLFLLVIIGFITVLIVEINNYKNNTTFYTWKFNTFIGYWAYNWSKWTVTLATLSAIELFIFEIYLYRKSITKKIINGKFLIISNNIKILNLTYLMLTSIVYNGFLIAHSDIVTNDPNSIQSEIDHVYVPAIFLCYEIVNWRKIYTEKSISFWNWFKYYLLISILPLIYLSYSLINGAVTGHFPYDELNYTIQGLKTFFYIFLVAITVALSTLITVFPLFTYEYDTKNKKKVKNEIEKKDTTDKDKSQNNTEVL